MINRILKYLFKHFRKSILDEVNDTISNNKCFECNANSRQVSKVMINNVRIDLVDLGRIKAFMFIDDLIYDQFVVESAKHYDVRRLVNEGLPQYSRKDLSKVDNANVIEFLSHYYLTNGLDFTFLDIGCNNGADTLAVADFFFNENIPAKIVAFEPGISGYLVEYNIKLNGFHDIVKFEPIAVSCHSLPTILRIQVGHSEDNRIVNLSINSESDVYHRIVDTTSIDNYCKNNKIDNHLIVKTDTQGGDYDVIMGMKGVIAERLVTFITEFAPTLISSRVNPIDFLNSIVCTHYLFDIGWYRFKKAAIKPLYPEDFTSYIDKLTITDDWTDILAIPRNLPEVNKILHIL